MKIHTIHSIIVTILGIASAQCYIGSGRQHYREQKKEQLRLEMQEKAKTQEALLEDTHLHATGSQEIHDS